MQVPVQLEIRLASLAHTTGRDTETLLQEAIERYADHEEHFLAAVEEGIASADNGNLIDDEKVLHWLQERERS